MKNKIIIIGLFAIFGILVLNLVYAITDCKNLYYVDDNNRECNQKQFCGTYMYQGLYTFENKTDCENYILASSDESHILVGNDSDSHGCKASAGYSWCESKVKCLKIWEENCRDDLFEESKVKILPEVASQRARERLGDLGFNVTLKEVGKSSNNESKSYYEVSAQKEGKMLGLFKIKGKVIVDVNSKTGEIIKVHKPWWGFFAGI